MFNLDNRIDIESIIYNQLLKNNVRAKVSVRLKNPISSLNKIVRTKDYIDSLHDLIGIRIIVETEDDCYSSAYLLERLYKTDNYRFKNYIIKPKDNGYQSLHMIILTLLKGQNVEVQIRTSNMHNLAENGTANHTDYKQKQDNQIINNLFNNIDFRESFNILQSIHQNFSWTIGEITEYKERIANIRRYLSFMNKI